MKLDPLGTPAHQIPVNVLRLRAEQNPDRAFLADADGQLTYGEVDDLADRHAAAYSALGVGKGDMVAVFMDNSTALAATAFGINRLGAIWSPFSTEYRGEWLREMLLAMRSRVLVIDKGLVGEVATLGPMGFEHVVVHGGTDGVDVPGATMHDLATFGAHDPFRGDVTLHHGETNAVLWTSGTTGRSKGVMQSHAVWMLWSQRHNEVFRVRVSDGDRFYYCMPMYNSGGWIMNVYPALLSGNTACIDKRFSATDFWDRLRHYDAHHTMTLGTMQVYLFGQPARDDDADNPLRTMVMVPAIPQILQPFKQRFAIERICGGFGQSEVMGATCYTSDMTLKPGSNGIADPEDLVETKILDDDDREVGVDEPGEICVRPRVPYALFSGYYDQPVHTLETFRNFWHHSGDLGRRDADGEIFFVDRKKDSLRHKGRNTSTFEVEHIARQFPGVANVAAVGVADPALEHEEELMIVIHRKPDTEIDPLEFCKFIDSKAPYFFVPRYVDVVDEMPMTPTEKIQKFVLRDRGVTATTWDRTTAAGDWAPTRPTSSPGR